MKVEIEKCVVESDTITIACRFIGRIESLSKELNTDRYKADCLENMILDKIAEIVAKEYLAQRKMEIINSLNKDDIVNAIQLKTIENFSINNRC